MSGFEGKEYGSKINKDKLHPHKKFKYESKN